MTHRWAPQTRYTLRRNTASIIKGLVWCNTLAFFNQAGFRILTCFSTLFLFRGCPLKTSTDRRVVQCGHFADKEEGGFFRCRRPHFLMQTTLNFSKFTVVRMDKEGEGEPVRNFSDKGKEVKFSRFCADVFYGRPFAFYFIFKFLYFLRKTSLEFFCFFFFSIISDTHSIRPCQR